MFELRTHATLIELNLYPLSHAFGLMKRNASYFTKKKPLLVLEVAFLIFKLLIIKEL
jgi:hypothetical protein